MKDAQSQVGGTGYVTDSMKAYKDGPFKPGLLHHFLLDCTLDSLGVFREDLKTLTRPSLVPTQKSLQTHSVCCCQRGYYAWQKKEMERIGLWIQIIDGK